MRYSLADHALHQFCLCKMQSLRETCLDVGKLKNKVADTLDVREGGDIADGQEGSFDAALVVLSQDIREVKDTFMRQIKRHIESRCHLLLSKPLLLCVQKNLRRVSFPN